MDVFWLKKLAGTWLMPLPLLWLLLLLALIMLLRKRYRHSLFYLFGGFLLLSLVSFPFLPNRLLAHTERQYPQFDLSQPVSRILILGGGHINDGALPLSAQLSRFSAYRVIEAVRLLQHNPDAQILLSGGSTTQPFTTAEMHRRMLLELGVANHQIRVLANEARDTEEEAELLKTFLQGYPFALVTSASHMPRAMVLFEAQGMRPLPAPTEHLVRYGDTHHWWSDSPDSANVYKAERWWYETLGRSWQAIKSWF